MSLGMMLFIIGLFGICGTLAWILLDCTKEKKKENELVYLALEKTYGSDTEKLKEVQSTLQLSGKPSERKNTRKTERRTKPITNACTTSEKETEKMTEPLTTSEKTTEIMTEKI